LDAAVDGKNYDYGLDLLLFHRDLDAIDYGYYDPSRSYCNSTSDEAKQIYASSLTGNHS